MALLVGLTGGMGSGKSTVSKLLAKAGAYIIDADEISRQLVEPGQPGWREIVETFGDGVLQQDQTLDRKKMADLIFQGAGNKKRLEAILHPKVFAEEKRQSEAETAKNPDGIVVLDAALLIESGNFRKVDKVVVISCPEEEQVRRIVARGKFSEEEVRKRLRNQMPLSEKLKVADHVLRNDTTLEALEAGTNALFRELQGELKHSSISQNLEPESKPWQKTFRRKIPPRKMKRKR